MLFVAHGSSRWCTTAFYSLTLWFHIAKKKTPKSIYNAYQSISHTFEVDRSLTLFVCVPSFDSSKWVECIRFERLTLLAIYRRQTYLSRGLVPFFLCALFGIDTFRSLYSQTWLCSRYKYARDHPRCCRRLHVCVWVNGWMDECAHGVLQCAPNSVSVYWLIRKLLLYQSHTICIETRPEKFTFLNLLSTKCWECWLLKCPSIRTSTRMLLVQL